MSKLSRFALWAYGLLVVAWLTLPTLVIVPVSLGNKASFVFPPEGWSLRWYRDLLEDPSWRETAANSLLIAGLAAALATVVGSAAAMGLSRSLSARNRAPIRAVLLTPLIIPEIVIGIGIYATFLELGLVGTLPGFVIAHAVLGVPLVLTTVMASLAGFDENLERASASLGAGPWATARQVTLPLIAPGIVAGALFAFILSFDNVIISLFIQTPDLNTLPVQMWSSMTRDTNPSIAAAATVVLLFTLAIMGVALHTLNRRTRRTEKGLVP